MIEETRQERFVDADAIARSLRETRRYVLYLARTGAIRSYPMGGRERIKRKFLLSEVRSDLVGRKRKIRRKRGPIMIVNGRELNNSDVNPPKGKCFH